MSEKQRLVTNTVHEPQANAVTSIRHSGVNEAENEEQTDKGIRVHFGNICVLGTASDEITPKPDEVRAYVYRESELPPPSENEPRTEAVAGVIGDFSVPIVHNYHFIREGTNLDVPKARDNHTHVDDDNYLIVWTLFGTTWSQSAKVPFKGNSTDNMTECEKEK